MVMSESNPFSQTQSSSSSDFRDIELGVKNQLHYMTLVFRKYSGFILFGETNVIQQVKARVYTTPLSQEITSRIYAQSFEKLTQNTHKNNLPERSSIV